MCLQVETIAIAKLRTDPKLAFRREIILAKDGGAVAIDWEHHDMEEHVRVQACLVLTSWQLGRSCYNPHMCHIHVEFVGCTGRTNLALKGSCAPFNGEDLAVPVQSDPG